MRTHLGASTTTLHPHLDQIGIISLACGEQMRTSVEPHSFRGDCISDEHGSEHYGKTAALYPRDLALVQPHD